MVEKVGDRYINFRSTIYDNYDKTDKTNMTYMTNTNVKKGGYESLVVYWLAVTIYDLNNIFCKRYISPKSRTYDQMVQATRSGKQNIVEGSLEPSVESNIKLTGVARASFAELLEDYRDYLREYELNIWNKDDTRVLNIRQNRDEPYRSYKSYQSYMSYTDIPENFSNLMITLCFKEGFLLDRLLQAQKNKFIREGGFRENLFKSRMEFKRKGH